MAPSKWAVQFPILRRCYDISPLTFRHGALITLRLTGTSRVPHSSGEHPSGSCFTSPRQRPSHDGGFHVEPTLPPYPPARPSLDDLLAEGLLKVAVCLFNVPRPPPEGMPPTSHCCAASVRCVIKVHLRLTFSKPARLSLTVVAEWSTEPDLGAGAPVRSVRNIFGQTARSLS